VSGACTTHAALPISCGWQPTRHHRVPALCEASAHAVQLNAARGPSWRARVRPAEALGRACQRDSRSEGPGAAPAPEDRPCHPCFAARKKWFLRRLYPRELDSVLAQAATRSHPRDGASGLQHGASRHTVSGLTARLTTGSGPASPFACYLSTTVCRMPTPWSPPPSLPPSLAPSAARHQSVVATSGTGLCRTWLGVALGVGLGVRVGKPSP
jgi:hypothetical protein